jgi:hypothetical protein
LAAHPFVDKEILQIADLARHPSIGMEEVVSDPDQRRGLAAELPGIDGVCSL